MSKLILSVLLALGVSAASVQAWCICGTVACPNERSACGIVVYIDKLGICTYTDSDGGFCLEVPDAAASYRVCVDTTTLPSGFTLKANCQTVRVDDANPYACVNFVLDGPKCSCPHQPGKCWLTGGGQIGSKTGDFWYSYGGVVNPGCSPVAAGGGNWNLVDHLRDIHFKGLTIQVDGCEGVPTGSPPVLVNIIHFSGLGIVEGKGVGSVQVVTFSGTAVDNDESGTAGPDHLILNVPGWFDIDEDVSRGNLQIHTSGCSKY